MIDRTDSQEQRPFIERVGQNADQGRLQSFTTRQTDQRDQDTTDQRDQDTQLADGRISQGTFQIILPQSQGRTHQKGNEAKSNQGTLPERSFPQGRL